MPSVREWLCSLICRKRTTPPIPPIPPIPPVSTDFVWDKAAVRTITPPELRDCLKKAFPDAEIKLAKAIYKYTALAEIRRWASFDPTNLLQYRDNELNCEDYAITDFADFRRDDNYFMGNGAFFFCWGWAELPLSGRTYHAWNICYADGKIYMLEPQSDAVWEFDDPDHDYRPDFIYG